MRKKGTDMKNKKKNININELAKTVRGSWNGVNPVTRIVQSKKHKPPRYKNKWEDE